MPAQTTKKKAAKMAGAPKRKGRARMTRTTMREDKDPETGVATVVRITRKGKPGKPRVPQLTLQNLTNLNIGTLTPLKT